jgi:hypothetical protein
MEPAFLFSPPPIFLGTVLAVLKSLCLSERKEKEDPETSSASVVPLVGPVPLDGLGGKGMMLSDPSTHFASESDGVRPNARGAAHAEGLDAKTNFVRASAQRGHISLDIPFYRTEGL